MSDQLVQWLEDNKITEVECLISDMAGIPRGKILPVAKYIAGLKGGGPFAGICFWANRDG